MKAIALTFAGAAVVSAFGLYGLAEAQPQRAPVVIENKAHPILLGRMVVTATALPAEAR